MRVAVVSAKYPFGPKEPYLDRELRALEPHVAGITVFPTSPTDPDYGFTNLPCNVERFGLSSARTLWGAFRALLAKPRQSLLGITRLLFASGSMRTKLKNLAVAPLGLAVGMELRRGGFSHVHSYWLSTPASVAYLAAAVAGIPWSSTAHRWDIYERNALDVKLRTARFVRAISARGRSDLLAAVPGLPPERVRVLHVGVDVAESAPPPHIKTDWAFMLLCAANLVPLKGHRDLLAALAQVRGRGYDVRCTIAGDGELRGELETLAGELGVADAVIFRGHVPHDALLDEIRAGRYDAMALTSRETPGGLMEGIPVALMEAMALGLPVVTTATGSITELVDAECGRVVPQQDIGAIASALAELAADGELRVTLARMAYRKIREEFDVVTVARELAQLLAAPNSVSSEQAVGSIRPKDTHSTEAVEAARGQG